MNGIKNKNSSRKAAVFVYTTSIIHTYMPAYLSNTQFLSFYDFRTLGQLLFDDGVVHTSDDVVNSDVLTTLLQRASGDVEAQCLKGGRYQLTDLQNLTDNSLAYLQGLIADLTYYAVVLRRGQDVSKYEQFDKAHEDLDKIGNGALVFNVQSVIDAGHMESEPVTLQSIGEQNFLRDSITMFPVRRITIDQL